jgi:hypothetical protein
VVRHRDFIVPVVRPWAPTGIIWCGDVLVVRPWAPTGII